MNDKPDTIPPKSENTSHPALEEVLDNYKKLDEKCETILKKIKNRSKKDQDASSIG